MICLGSVTIERGEQWYCRLCLKCHNRYTCLLPPSSVVALADLDWCQTQHHWHNQFVMQSNKLREQCYSRYRGFHQYSKYLSGSSCEHCSRRQRGNRSFFTLSQLWQTLKAGWIVVQPDMWAHQTQIYTLSYFWCCTTKKRGLYDKLSDLSVAL